MLSMLGGVSIQTVASDVGETTEDLVTQSEGKDLREDENVLPQEEQIEDDDNAISQDIISEEKDNEVGNGQEITEEQRLNYIYVESPYLETPNTQNLVVSWGNGDENIAELSLLYQKDGGAIQEWKSSSTEGNLYLFSQEFISEESTGSYKILSIKLAGNGVEEYSLESLNAVAEFGVNVEYQGYNPKESIIDDKNLETSVVTIDENGNTEGQDSIIEALEEVGVNNKSTFSSKSRANNNIIVALDPGHDERDAGASYNGLREEDLTLKIANYCKVELEEYAGVTVYMTRQSNACPVGVAAGKNHAGPCIRKRVQNAANAGAKIFVSFHLNAATNSAAKGAEVIIPNSSWKYEQYVQGRELAEKILTELEALGLQKRSVYYKNSSNGETYADGNIADYFAVQNAGKQYGIPGLIVEHAFISNVGGIDQSLLNSEEGLKKLGVADATAIAKYFGVSKGYWETDANGKKYYYENNQKVYGEKAIAGKWYHFDESTGAMTIGWYDYPGKRVCYAETGEMLYGEQAIDGKWYYFNGVTGAMVTGWHEFAGKTVYYDKKTGEMLYGEQTIDGKTYYFDTLTGGVYTGWREKDGRKVYSFGKKGLAQGEQAIGGKWYCFEEKTGYMVTGFYELPGKRVCYAETGEMLYGEQAIDGKWYYFNGVTGAMVTGWHEFAGKTVYYDKKTGEMLYGEQTIDGKTYYFDTLTGGMKRDAWINGMYYGNDGCQVDYNATYYKIEGATNTNVEQMVRFYNNNSRIPYPADKLASGGASSLKEFAEIYYEEASKEGIRVEVAWAQTMLETGYLKFEGQVSIEQFNFAGLGATDGGSRGADFSVYGNNGVRMGIRAQIQHLKAYSSPLIRVDTLKEQCVDPRFALVTPKGCAPYVEWLGQQENPSKKGWATSKNYGYDILNLILKLLQS